MSWETTLDASCEEAGEEIGTCSVCGTTQTREIAATGHSMEWTPADGVNSPCEQISNGICSACGHEEREVVESHTYNSNDHDMSEFNFDMGTGTVICYEACGECGQRSSSYEIYEASVSEDGALTCGCGSMIPY